MMKRFTGTNKWREIDGYVDTDKNEEFLNKHKHYTNTKRRRRTMYLLRLNLVKDANIRKVSKIHLIITSYLGTMYLTGYMLDTSNKCHNGIKILV